MRSAMRNAATGLRYQCNLAPNPSSIWQSPHVIMVDHPAAPSPGQATEIDPRTFYSLD